MERLIRKIIEYSWVLSTSDGLDRHHSRIYDHNSSKYHNHIDNVNDKDGNDTKTSNGNNRDDGYYNIPYIIILESWPYALGNTNINPINSSSLNIIDYSDCYRKIVKYYNVSLWSYRSILWSKRHKIHNQNGEFLQNNFLSNNPDYNGHNHHDDVDSDDHDDSDDDDDDDDSDYIKEVLKYNWDHPYWYHHLYFSDLYSSILEIYFSNCYQNNNYYNNDLSSGHYNNDKIINYTTNQLDKSQNNSIYHHSHHDHQKNHTYHQKTNKLTKMPLMLTKYNHSYICNEKIPYTLDINADKYFNFNDYNSSIVISSVYSSSISDDRNDNIIRGSNSDYSFRNHSIKAWMMYADRPNKYGFIDILDNIYEDTNDNNHYHINHNSYDESNNDSSNQAYDQYHHHQQQQHENNKPLKINSMKFHFNPIQNDSILMIEYLKTYQNAGLFDLILCNHHHKKKKNNRIYSTIDTLWKDYKTNLYSLNELYILNLSSKYYNNCNEIIIQHNINYCNDKKKHNMNLYDKKQHECFARTSQQKVKIISVKICTQN